MTNKQITGAYIALSRMGNMQFPLPVTYRLFLLRQKLKTQFDFCAEQEQAIISRHNGVPTNDGDYQFADKETTMATYTEMQELHDMDVDVELDPVEVDINQAMAGNMSMNDIQALDGIVIFK